MDLNKERALFESWLMSKFSIEADSDFIYLNGDEYAHVPTQARWETWVEAKSQVPEGFVLVTKEPTEDVISKMCQSVILGDDENGNPVYLSTSEANEAYLAMIESQEPAHD